MKRVVSILILVFGLTSGDVGVGSGVDKATTENYYNNNPNPAPIQYNQQAAQPYQNYVSPTGYYNYNYNSNPGLNNNYYTSNQQKQDLFSGLGLGNGNQGGFQGGNGDSGDNFDLSSGGGIAGTALAALGITKVTKLGLIVFGLFFFVIVPLFVVPTILGIISIIMSAVGLSGGGGGGGGGGNDWMQKLRDAFGKDENGQRALVMSTFYKFANNEDCIEKLSCAIGQRSLTRNLKNVFAKKTNIKSTETKTTDEDASTFSDEGSSKREEKTKGSLMSRISRAIKTEDCQVYKCSILSYFS